MTKREKQAQLLQTRKHFQLSWQRVKWKKTIPKTHWSQETGSLLDMFHKQLGNADFSVLLTPVTVIPTMAYDIQDRVGGACNIESVSKYPSQEVLRISSKRRQGSVAVGTTQYLEDASSGRRSKCVFMIIAN